MHGAYEDIRYTYALYDDTNMYVKFDSFRIIHDTKHTKAILDNL